MLLLSGDCIINRNLVVVRHTNTPLLMKSLSSTLLYCYNITTKFAVGLKENKTKFLRYIGCLNFTKYHIKHVSLKILVHARHDGIV